MFEKHLKRGSSLLREIIGLMRDDIQPSQARLLPLIGRRLCKIEEKYQIPMSADLFAHDVQDAVSVSAVASVDGNDYCNALTIALRLIDAGMQYAPQHGTPLRDRLLCMLNSVPEYRMQANKHLRNIMDRLMDAERGELRAESDDMGTVAPALTVEDVQECVRSTVVAVRELEGCPADAVAVMDRYLEHTLTQSPGSWKETLKAADTIAFFIKYMSREDIDLAYEGFRDLNRGNKLCNVLLDDVQRYASRPLIDVKAMEVGRGDAEDAMVKDLLQPNRCDPPVMQLLKEITGKFMQHMKRKLGIVSTPHHTQLLTLLMYHEFYTSSSGHARELRTLVAEIGTGEGKSIVIAMLAIYLVKHHRKKVHILANNEALMTRDFQSNKKFFEMFELEDANGGLRSVTSSSSKTSIDEDADICYCLSSAVMGSYLSNVESGGKGLTDVILIVDEVDDLVIDEKPKTNYVKVDAEKSTHVKACFDQLKSHGDAACKPLECDDTTWTEAQDARREVLSWRVGRDYQKFEGKYRMLDDRQRIMQSTVSMALDYLNYSEGLITQVSKRSTSMVTCGPYVFNQYERILGLTGSVGGEAEAAYLKDTYSAEVFTVPKFLDTCGDTEQKEINDGDVRAFDCEEDQHREIVALAKEKCSTVPVIVITKNPEQVDRVYRKLSQRVDGARVQKLLAVDEQGKDLVGVSDEIIQRATQPMDETMPMGVPKDWRITVTDYFGGRGIDYRLQDQDANAAGGIMLIITHMPDSKREWIQWIGRTGRQDKNGQISVLLNRTEEFLATVPEAFEPGADVIEVLLAKRNETSATKLEGYSKDIELGDRLNELCEAVYKENPQRGQWPGTENLRELRDFLERPRCRQTQPDVDELKAKLGIRTRVTRRPHLKPKNFYHGTSLEAAISIQKKGFRVDLSGTNAGAALGPGVYITTTLEKALNYAKANPCQGAVLQLEVHLGRCYEVKDDSLAERKAWQERGYDSAWAKEGVIGEREENCVVDPTRVKITNVFLGKTGEAQAAGYTVEDGKLVYRRRRLGAGSGGG